MVRRMEAGERTRVDGMIRNSDITGCFCNVGFGGWCTFLHHEPCSRSLVIRNEKAGLLNSREWTCGCLENPIYWVIVTGFSFRAVLIYVAFCEEQRALFNMSCFSPSSSFLSPTTSGVTHRLYFTQVRSLSSLPIYHTKSPDRIYLTHGLALSSLSSVFVQ